MREKKKLIILTSIILGVLVAVLGVAYAAFTYDRTGNNSDLVLGDIYMHYKENNQLMFNDAMPTSIEKYYTSYKVNPVMATQEVVDNELTRCVDLLRDVALPFDEGSDAETFCKGTGTALDGMTFQQLSDLTPAEHQHQDFLDAEVILQDGDTYKVNPVMATQEINELTACVIWYGGSEFDEGSNAETFCRGIGTMYGMTLQETLDAMPEEQKNYFLESGGQGLLDVGVILPKIENLPYFEFTISGKNTYLDEDIWYEIVLNHGDNHETRTTRIKDELLRFTLVEVENDEIKTILLNDKKYNDLSNKRIWVETIKANTTSEINKKYRLYAWISEDTVIGNVNEDYTTEEWNDVFASIKVNVTGDFNEKELQLEYEEMYDVTDASCFRTTLVDGGVAITDYSSSCGSDVVIPKTINGYNVIKISYEAFVEKGLTSVVIPNSVTYIDTSAFQDNQLTSVIFEENSKLDSIMMLAFAENRILEVTIPNSVTYFDCEAFDSDVVINKSEELTCTAGPR